MGFLTRAFERVVTLIFLVCLITLIALHERRRVIPRQKESPFMSWIWAGWIIFLIVSFAAFEAFAIATRRMTLSRFVWTASKNFPLLPFIAGLLAGGLAVHFWWGGIVCFAPV